MPPLRPLPDSITSLSDQELANRLKKHDVTIGPVVSTTRRVYERKLFQIETGEKAAPSTTYTPVDDDDDDNDDDEEDDNTEEIQPKQVTRKRLTQSSRSETRTTPIDIIGKPTPRRPLHENLQNPSIRSPSSASHKSTSQGSKGLPAWLKLLTIVIIAVIVFLVIKNMESDPGSNIPNNVNIEV